MNGRIKMSIKYLKQIEGVSAPVRVDVKPSFGEVSTTSEYRMKGEWYSATGAKLPPQSYIEDSNGQLVGFEVINGEVVDIHTAGYAPTIVENRINVKSLYVSEGFDLGQTRQDVTAFRSYGVTYTNSTTKPIEILVTNTTYASYFTLTLDGIVYNNIGGGQYTGSILPGETYQITPNTGTLNQWVEIR